MMISKEALQKYVAALNSADADQVAACYAEECNFQDGGARLLGFEDVVANGKANVKAAFAGVFTAFKVKAEIVKLSDNYMEYDVTLANSEIGELFIPCIGAATVNDEGLITDYIVRPR